MAEIHCNSSVSLNIDVCNISMNTGEITLQLAFKICYRLKIQQSWQVSNVTEPSLFSHFFHLVHIHILSVWRPSLCNSLWAPFEISVIQQIYLYMRTLYYRQFKHMRTWMCNKTLDLFSWKVLMYYIWLAESNWLVLFHPLASGSESKPFGNLRITHSYVS